MDILREHDNVELTVNMSLININRGTKGVIVHDYHSNSVVCVEFIDETNITIGTFDVFKENLKKL